MNALTAPDGTEALKIPSVVVKSTSTVGLPRESMISRALQAVIEAIDLSVALTTAERSTAHIIERIIIFLELVEPSQQIMDNSFY